MYSHNSINTCLLESVILQKDFQIKIFPGRLFNKCTIYFISWVDAQPNFLGIICSVLIIQFILFLSFNNKHNYLFQVYFLKLVLDYIFPLSFTRKATSQPKRRCF